MPNSYVTNTHTVFLFYLVRSHFYTYILTYAKSVNDMKGIFNFCLQRSRKTTYAKINIYWVDVHSNQYL